MPSQRPRKVTWRQIRDDLRADITNRVYGPGQQLPSASTLMANYGVARQTVQNAFDALGVEGLVTTRPGAGVFVRVPPTVNRLARNRLARQARNRGRGFFLGDAQAANGFTPTVDVTISRAEADQRTADALDLEPGAEVVVRHRLMSADGVPVQIATSRFPAALVAGTAVEQPNPGTTGVWGVLETLGHAVATPAVETVSTRMPTPEERELLRLADGVPVMCITRVAYDAAGLPLEINDMVLAGDRYVLSYDINVD